MKAIIILCSLWCSIFNVCGAYYMGEINVILWRMGQSMFLVHLKELNIKINKAKEKLITLYGYEPTVQEIAKELEVDVMDVVEAIDASYYPTSLLNRYMKKMDLQFQWKKE